MNNKNEIEKRLKLNKAKSYKNMMWLGLLVFPLVFVFFAMSRGALRDAEVYGLKEDEQKTAKKIRSGTTGTLVFMILLWVFSIIFITYLYIDAMETARRLMPSRY